MNITEKIIELNNNGLLEMLVENAVYKEVFQDTQSKMADIMKDVVIGKTVTCSTYGTGTVVSATAYNPALEHIIVEIAFADGSKKFSLTHIMNHKFITFDDELVTEVWDRLFEAHTGLTNKYNELEATAHQIELDLRKKAEAEKKSEARYQKLKEQAVKSFDEMVQQAPTTLSETDEFYYALGWLANHVGSMTAILPDYLGSAFEKHFGSDTPKTLVDGRAKTSGGYAKQWSWEFKCTIKKLNDTVVPACIQSVTTDFSKGIHNTSFLWDLVTNHGFRFGKKQDVDQIKNTVPAQYISSFEAGLTA